jgi:purine-binding chemotaxis protein CheW
MTDDDRMDRARRIREMREETTDAQAQAQTDDSPDESVEDDSPSSDELDDSGARARDSGADTDGDESGNGTQDAGGDDGSLAIPGAEVDDVAVDVDDLAEQAGLDSADGEHEEGGGDDDDVAGAVGMAGAESAGAVETAAETRVLEFNLGAGRYCLDIDHVEEIVKRETVTRVPNTPGFVEGVVDLRGQITTILDPKELLDIDDEGSKELIVVFDPEEFEDQGAIGWVVDDVNQVTPVVDEEVNESPVDADHVNGVVERDGEFVVWTQPDVAIENAAG